MIRLAIWISELLEAMIDLVIVGYEWKIYCFLRKYYYIFGFIAFLSGFDSSPHNYEIWLIRYSTCSAGFWRGSALLCLSLIRYLIYHFLLPNKHWKNNFVLLIICVCFPFLHCCTIILGYLNLKTNWYPSSPTTCEYPFYG
jgi:hypothetical protein